MADLITPEMSAVIDGTMLCYVATVNADGSPNLSPKASLKAHGPNRLLFANIASPKTVENIQARPDIEINVVDIFARKGFRFRGTARIAPPDSAEHKLIADWVMAEHGDKIPVHDVIDMTVSAAESVLSPAYTFFDGVTDEVMRTAYLKKYGVQEAG